MQRLFGQGLGASNITPPTSISKNPDSFHSTSGTTKSSAWTTLKPTTKTSTTESTKIFETTTATNPNQFFNPTKRALTDSLANNFRAGKSQENLKVDVSNNQLGVNLDVYDSSIKVTPKPVVTSTYSPEEDAKFLAALLTAVKNKGRNKIINEFQLQKKI